MIGVNALCDVFLRQTVVFIDKVVEEQCSYSRMNLDMKSPFRSHIVDRLHRLENGEK